jgi:hypothetical protein
MPGNGGNDLQHWIIWEGINFFATGHNLGMAWNHSDDEDGTIPDGHLVSGGARPTFRQSQNVTDLSESASNYFGTPSTPGHRLANVGSIEFPNYLLNTLE